MYTSFDIFFEPSVIRINVVYSCTLIYFKSRRITIKATIPNIFRSSHVEGNQIKNDS